MASLIQRRKQEQRGKENGSRRQFSVPLVFATKTAKKIQLTFWCITQQALQNIQNIRNNRSFGKRKTYLFRNILVFRNTPNENICPYQHITGDFTLEFCCVFRYCTVKRDVNSKFSPKQWNNCKAEVRVPQSVMLITWTAFNLQDSLFTDVVPLSV